MARPEIEPLHNIVDFNNRVIGLIINPNKWPIQGLRDLLYYQVLAAKRTKIIIISGKKIITLEPEDLFRAKKQKGGGLEVFLDKFGLMMKQAQSVNIYEVRPTDPIEVFVEEELLPSKIDEI